jgi:hypoxanthine phosphoribosyltransferase
MTAIRLLSLNVEEAIETSKRLAGLAQSSGFLPERIIGIAKGGLLPAYEAALAFDCELEVVRVERPFTKLKSALPLDLLPASCKHGLRRLEMAVGLYSRLKRRYVFASAGTFSRRRYLIVDDSLDTGGSVGAVLAMLLNGGVPRELIRIAAITQIFDNASPSADYATYRNVNITFPWSHDAADYGDFLQYCEKRPSLAKEMARSAGEIGLAKTP